MRLRATGDLNVFAADVGGGSVLGQELEQWSQKCLAIGDAKACMLELAHHGFKVFGRGVATDNHLLDGVPKFLEFAGWKFNGPVDAIKNPT